VVVITHQAPSQYLKSVELFDVGYDFDEFVGLVWFRKDHFSSSCSTVHVVVGVGDEEAR
jgi:hypothetical protein